MPQPNYAKSPSPSKKYKASKLATFIREENQSKIHESIQRLLLPKLPKLSTFDTSIWHYWTYSPGEMIQEDEYLPPIQRRSFLHYLDAVLGNIYNFIEGLRAAVVKDALDTFKPYKGAGIGYDFVRDLSQPVNGFKNMVKGLVKFVASPLMLIADLLILTVVSLYHPTGAGRKEQIFPQRLATGPFVALYALGVNAMRAVEGLLTFLRGASQFFLTPLTWLGKIPARAINTLYFGAPKVEQNSSMSKIINLLIDNKECTFGVYQRLHDKFTKQRSPERAQATGIVNENSHFTSLKEAYEARDERDQESLANYAEAQRTYHQLWLPKQLKQVKELQEDTILTPVVFHGG